MDELRQSQMTILATSSLEGASSYLRASEPVVNLSLLTEVENIIEVSDQLANEVKSVNEQSLDKCRKNSDVSFTHSPFTCPLMLLCYFFL